MYFDGVALDEYGNINKSTFYQVILPALFDRRGWCVLMGTPNGPNHFRDTYYEAIKDEAWYTCHLPHTATNIIPDEDIALAKKMMEPEEFAQEMLCSFEASVRGAIYARQMEQAYEENRIGDYPLDRISATDIFMDLGWADDTTMLFTQSRPDGVVIGHAYADRLKPIDDYIVYLKDYVKTHKLRLGTVWLPHDAKAKTLQTGKSTVESFIDRKSVV